VKLKPGAEVDVTIEAPIDAAQKKNFLGSGRNLASANTNRAESGTKAP
jgi:hypothetical protein